MSEKAQELADLRKSNAEKFAGIQKRGADIEGVGVVMTRLNALIDFLLAPDTSSRIDFEIKFETDIQEILTKVEQQLNRATLLNGVSTQVPNIKGLLRPDGTQQ